MYKHVHEWSPYKFSYVSNRSLLNDKHIVCVATILFYVLQKYKLLKLCMFQVSVMMQYHNLTLFRQVRNCMVAMMVLMVIANYSSVSIVTGYRIDDQKTGVQFPARGSHFFFSTAFRLVLSLPFFLSRWYRGTGASSQTAHSLPFSVKVMNVWSYTSTLPRLNDTV